MASVSGNLLNVATVRKHKVSLCPTGATDPADTTYSGQTNSSGYYGIAPVDYGSYRFSVDDLWWCDPDSITVSGNMTQDLSLITPPALPLTITSSQTFVGGYCTNPTGSGHAVHFYPAGSTDPAGSNSVASCNTNNRNYYRVVVPSGATYRVAIDHTYWTASDVVVGSTYDCERHDIHV